VIECFDISLFQGTDAVASQVCFVEGVADKSRYRKYNIKTVEGTDDYASLREVLTRRLKKGDFPDLLLVDGGKGQLAVAMAVMKDLNLNFPVAAIAKDPERLFLPNRKDGIVLKEHTKERYLLERIRDEAHRFAITTHRAKRAKRIIPTL
jgi:excinuclease ABC subunit C